MKLVNLFSCLAIVISIAACSDNVAFKGEQGNIVSLSNKNETLPSAENVEYTVISRADYQDKLHGFWLGQSIANWTGLITEMDKVGTSATMPFYTDEDWGSIDLPAIWGEGVPHSDVIDFFFVEKGQPWGSDDDTDIEYMYQYLHEQHKTSLLTAEQISKGWLAHIYSEEDAPLYKKFPEAEGIKENFLWESNQQSRILMEHGMMPPATSEPENNSKYMMIDAQLTTELFGLLAPVRSDVALKISYLPIRTSAKYDAEWISQFYVIMHSLASKVDQSLTIKKQTQWLAEQAKLILPKESTPATMYAFIKESYQNNPDKNDWEKTRDEIHQRYQLKTTDGYSYKTPFEANINFAASLVSLFYGEGDIVRTIQIGTLTGWDSDNPTATWGGLLGFMIAKEGIEKAFKQYNLSETYSIHRTRRGFPDHTPNKVGEDTFSMMAKRAIKVIDQVVIEQMKGEVNLANDTWLIPIKEQAFIHPGAINSEAGLGYVKEQIKARKQPWLKEFNNLKNSQLLTRKPHALEYVNTKNVRESGNMRDDALAAYSLALMWVFTEDKTYANHAIEILNAWSKFKGFTSGTDQDKLQAGWVGAILAPTAEIMRTYQDWSKDQITEFQLMFEKAFYPQLTTASSWNGNVDLTQIDALISIAVFNDDKPLFDMALTRLEQRNPAYFYLTSDGNRPASIKGDSDNVEKFWSKPTQWVDGLTQETCRDNGHHAQYGLASALHVSEVAWNQGVDIYTKNQDRYTAAMELMAKQLLTNDFSTCKNTTATKTVFNTWEIGFNHYRYRKGISLPYTEKLIETVVRKDSLTASWNIMYETLTHANIH